MKELTVEEQINQANEEILLLKQGKDSVFWQFVYGKWSGFKELALKSLLDPKYQNRDFLAGKVKAMDDLLEYPGRHIANLERKIEILKNR